MIKLKKLLTEESIPNIRKVQITNAEPDYIRLDHIDKTLKAVQKVDKKLAKQFQKLGDKYKKIREVMGKYGMDPPKWQKEYTKLVKAGRDLITFAKANL